MTTPNKKMILEKAVEMWKCDRAKAGDPSFQLNPEYSELREGGYLNSARSELMYSSETKNVRYDVENFGEFSVDLEEAMRSGVYVSGTTGSGKSDIGMYIAEELMRKDVILVVFDPSQDWLLRSSIPQYKTLNSSYVDAIPETSIIYDLSNLSVRQCQMFVEKFNEQIMRHQALNRLERKKYFLTFEEAHIVFPEGCMRSKRYESTVRMMTTGRNYDVRFMAITQFASLIDKNAMRYMVQRYFGQTNEVNDVVYIRKIIGQDSERLKTLDSGEFLYFNKGKVSKVYVEPYISNVAKEELKPTLAKIEPILMSPRTQPNYAVTKAVVTSLLLLLGLVIGLSQAL